MIQVRQSYSRLKDLEMLQPLLIIDRNKFGISITRSMMNFIRNRCHVLFFGSSLNGMQAVQENIISMFTMCAKRMHVHFKNTSFSRITRNKPFLALVISNCIQYGARQICSTLNRRRKLDLSELDLVESIQYQLHDSLPVSYEEVRTLKHNSTLILQGFWPRQ